MRQFTTIITLFPYNSSMSRIHMWMVAMRTLIAGTGPARRSIFSLRLAMLLDLEISGDFHIWPTRMEAVGIYALVIDILLESIIIDILFNPSL